MHFRWSKGYYEAESRNVHPPVRDTRGPIMGAVGKAQTLLAPEHVNEAADLYQSGMSLATIAARFNTSAHTVRRALLSRDVEMRTPWQHMHKPGT